MRPSQLRPSVLSTEGFALLDHEAAAFRNRYNSSKPVPAATATRPYAPAVKARMSSGLLIRLLLVVQAIEGSREDLHNAINRELVHRGLRLHTVLEYGDEAARSRQPSTSKARPRAAQSHTL